MASIYFSIQPVDNCEGLYLTDLTGRQPDAPDGYGATAILADYTGTLAIYNASGTLVVDNLAVTPSTTGIGETIDISSEGLTDGIYRCVYTVSDATPEELGTAEGVFLLDCVFDCNISNGIGKLATCSCCDNDANDLARARDYRALAITLAQFGNLIGASTLFTRAQEKLASFNCNC